LLLYLGKFGLFVGMSSLLVRYQNFMYPRAILCTIQISIDFYYVPVGGRGGVWGLEKGARKRGIEGGRVTSYDWLGGGGGLAAATYTRRAQSTVNCTRKAVSETLNRERESRPRIGSDATFFWDSCSNLEIDNNLRISHNLGLGLAANISTALAIQPDCYREIEII
jgi:hypothetical protein